MIEIFLEIFLGLSSLGLIYLGVLLYGSQNSRIDLIRKQEAETEEEFKLLQDSLEVKREVDNNLANDPDYAKRVRDKYND